MAWIRLSDDYNDHPKFDTLSDGAFRLWHQAMGFCRKFKTDGLIPMKTVRDLKAYGPKRMRELLTPWREGENPLWYERGAGIQVHDYLEWNPSKDEENERRADSRERMRQSRENRRRTDVAPQPTPNISPTSEATARDVPGWDGKKESFQKELSDDLAERAGRLRQETYPRLYAKHRHGAKLRLMANALEFQEALDLVRHWDDARLEKLAALVLTTEDPFIASTDRGFKIFAMKATWADDRLSEWEAKRAAETRTA